MFKRKRSMYQRIKILIRALLRHRNLQKHSCQWQLSKKKIVQYLQRLFNQQKPFCDSITICYEFTEDRKKHMTAIEHSRNKKIFDNLKNTKHMLLSIKENMNMRTLSLRSNKQYLRTPT
jgi:hypothetical protein